MKIRGIEFLSNNVVVNLATDLAEVLARTTGKYELKVRHSTYLPTYRHKENSNCYFTSLLDIGFNFGASLAIEREDNVQFDKEEQSSINAVVSEYGCVCIFDYSICYVYKKTVILTTYLERYRRVSKEQNDIDFQSFCILWRLYKDEDKICRIAYDARRSLSEFSDLNLEAWSKVCEELGMPNDVLNSEQFTNLFILQDLAQGTNYADVKSKIVSECKNTLLPSLCTVEDLFDYVSTRLDPILEKSSFANKEFESEFREKLINKSFLNVGNDITKMQTQIRLLNLPEHLQPLLTSLNYASLEGTCKHAFDLEKVLERLKSLSTDELNKLSKAKVSKDYRTNGYVFLLDLLQDDSFFDAYWREE